MSWPLRLAMMAVLVVIAWAEAKAQPVMPRAALLYRTELTRVAHAEWGLDAPIAAFAAQLHQESGWRTDAVSRVGALGMAQFMPATAKWWCERLGLSVQECQPTNPRWAMRSMVGYDRWLIQRVKGDSEFDRLWAALRSYNGGLGHWQAEAKAAGSFKRAVVDSKCGAAKRSVVHCRENLDYPRRILITLQPLYASWGGEVAP
ncbi:MAG: transglycosylase SLT domain-containing protein [Methylomicrobium sp.]|nr:transglycosylase SLT domain-containing protein [Methylomicrobium sp.]